MSEKTSEKISKNLVFPRKSINKQVKNDEFSVVQFNTLADFLCDEKSFPCVKETKCLDWKFRKKLLLEEMELHKADIMCFEEVDHVELFSEHFKSTHDWLYKSREYVKFGKKTIYGNVLFWNKKKFKLVKKVMFNYPEQRQTAILALFQIKDQLLCVAGTHLKASLGYEELRFKEVSYLLKMIKEFLQSYDKNIPTIIIGDFNEVSKSKLYELLLKEKFNSAYGNKKEPWTTYKKRKLEVLRTIDYIFYKNLEVKVTLEIPDFKKFPDRLPCMNYPSDHLLISASFSFVKQSEKEKLIGVTK